MTLRDLREALLGNLNVRVEAGSTRDYEKNGPLMARIPIAIDSRIARNGRPPGQLPMLPDLNADLEPPRTPESLRAMYDRTLKSVWNSQTLQNQFYGVWLGVKHESPEDRAWREAVAWIRAKYAPPEPEPAITFEWNWPAADYVRPRYDEEDW